MPVEQVLTKLGVQAERGLSSAESQQRLAEYGPTALVENEESPVAKILEHFTGPITYMIEAAALASNIEDRDAIDTAVISGAQGSKRTQQLEKGHIRAL